MRTYKDKLQNHKRNRHLQNDVRIISQVYNHFAALTLRHFRIFGHCDGYKRASYNRLSAHLTKLKNYRDTHIGISPTRGHCKNV